MLALIGGLLLGLLGAVVVAARVTVGSFTVPWGLALMLAAVGVGARGSAWTAGTRRAAAAFGMGWIVPSVILASTGRGGDVVLPDVPRTFIYLIGGLVLVLLATAWPLPRGLAAAVAAVDAAEGDALAAATDQPAAPLPDA
jgi:hypothetical protein